MSLHVIRRILFQENFLPIFLQDTDSRPRLSRVNYHGSLLLQHLFKFNNTKLLDTSILNMEQVEVMTLSCDPCGSHVIEAFFDSSTIKMRTKEDLLNQMNVSYGLYSCLIR